MLTTRVARSAAQPITATFDAMGTSAHIVVLVDRADRAVDLIRVAQSTVDRLERRWSRFLPNSDISRVNASPGRPVQVHPSTIDVVTQAIDAHRQTSGVFDPTVGGSLCAGGYDRPFSELAPLLDGRDVSAPSPEEVIVHTTATAITVPHGCSLDLGGIGKGAAADITAHVLLEAGADGAMVNLGGDLRASGEAPEGGWRVVLDCPGSSEQRSIWIAAGAVCTSSITKRQWASLEGRRHHIVDPASGRPTTSDVATATVIGASATQCEVLATTATAIGVEQGRRLLETHHTSGLLVDSEGHLHDVGEIGAFTRA